MRTHRKIFLLLALSIWNQYACSVEIGEIPDPVKFDLPAVELRIPYIEIPHFQPKPTDKQLQTFADLKRLRMRLNPLITILANPSLGIQVTGDLRGNKFFNSQHSRLLQRFQEAVGVGMNLVYEFE